MPNFRKYSPRKELHKFSHSVSIFFPMSGVQFGCNWPIIDSLESGYFLKNKFHSDFLCFMHKNNRNGGEGKEKEKEKEEMLWG